MQLLVKQSRPNSPMATRNLYLQARPVEVYPIVYALLPGYAVYIRHCQHVFCMLPVAVARRCASPLTCQCLWSSL